MLSSTISPPGRSRGRISSTYAGYPVLSASMNAKSRDGSAGSDRNVSTAAAIRSSILSATPARSQ
jgi:hypothetical protein